MSDTPTPLPAPPDWLVNFIDLLITDLATLGADVAIADAQAQVPFLALPVIGSIFSYLVTSAMGVVASNREKYVNLWILQAQSQLAKDNFQLVIQPLLDTGNLTDEQMVAVKAAIDRLVQQ